MGERLQRILSYTVTETKMFVRDKEAVFWVIIWPIMLVLLAAYVFIPPSAGEPVTLDVGVVNHDTSSGFNGTVLIKLMEEAEYNGTRLFNIYNYTSEDEMLRDIGKGRLDAGIVIPDGFGRNLTMGTARLYVYIGGSSPYTLQVNRAVLSEYFTEFEQRTALYKVNVSMTYIENQTRDITGTGNYTGGNLTSMIYRYLIGIANPLDVDYEYRAPEAVVNRPAILGWYVLGAVGMTMMYTGFMLGAVMIVVEKERGRLERILASPSTPGDLIIGKSLAGYLVLASASVIIILTGLAVGARITWSPLEPAHLLVPLHFLIIAAMTMSMGALLSLVSTSSKGASGLATSLGLVLSFTAGIWFPREWMPGPLRVLASVFPVTWSLDTIRDIMVYGAGLDEAMYPTLRCAAAAAILLLVSIAVYRKTLRRYMEA